MVMVSTERPYFQDTRTQFIEYPRPHILTNEEYQQIRQMCIAAAHTRLLNTKATDRNERIADAIFMVVSGYEMGVPMMTSLRHMYTVDGKLGCTMQLLLSIARRGGVQFQIPDVAEVTDVAKIGIKRPGEDEWRYYSYTMDMAKAAGLAEKGNWVRMPKIMLTWRAVGMGVRFEIPDVISGLYPLEELLPDMPYDESGSPIGDVSLYSAPMAQRRSQTRPASQPAAQPRQPSTPTPSPAPAPMSQTQPAVWPSVAEGQKLVSWLSQRLQILPEEVLAYAGIAKADDISKETGWGKYDTANIAALAIKTAMEEKLSKLPPATPKHSPFGKPAAAAAWTGDELLDIEDFVEANFFDTEAQLPMSSSDMLKKLELTAWTDIADGYKAAVGRIAAYASANFLPLIVHHATYVKTNGAHTVLGNAVITVRLYGSDQLRVLGEDWLNYVETIKDGQKHVFADDQMPDLVVSGWRTQPPKTESGSSYNIVLKDSLFVPTIEF